MTQQNIMKHGGEIVAEVLLDEGVKHTFGVPGGHDIPFLDPVMWSGVKNIQMRHEQSGPYAAAAYACVTRTVGVCHGTAGPGMTNMISGVQQAYWRKDPIVCLFGQHETINDGRATLQEAYGCEVVRSMTKWCYRVTNWANSAYLLKKAFKIAKEYPPGPVALDLPIDVFIMEKNRALLTGWTPNWLKSPPPRTEGDPALVEKVVDLILQAERPCICAGEGVHWADASPELNELVELLQIPIHTRRLGRGAVPETHPLHFHGGFRMKVFRMADLIVIIGLRLGYLEGFGMWNPAAKYVQINESDKELEFSLPTEVAIVGNPKLVLQQMLQALKERKAAPVKKEWQEAVKKAREEDNLLMAKRINRVANAKPIHPDKLGQEIAEFLDPSATIVLDSFTGSSYLTDKIQATFSGQILDSGEHAGVGHGVGMGIGAQVGRPGKQVFVMMGDGGMGVAAMDIETAVRHKLPVVYGVYNNSLWISGYQNNVYGRNNELIGGGPDEGYNQWWYRMLPGIRYDKLAEVIPGLHGEHVESPEEIKPALYRAFNSGKTAVIDFVVDDEIIHPLCTLPSIMVPMVGHVYASPYFDKMPARGRKLMDRMMKGERISPYELFADKYGYSPDEW